VAYPLGLFLAFLGTTGWFGEFAMLAGFGATMGTGIGAWVGLIADWRARRRPPVSPWADPPSGSSRDHMKGGAAIGLTLGTVLGVLELLLP
jgi:hypothetical protein